ncbi:MAG: response regulator transcription factor [Gammaproteobacteria bacterium]|nr:response regulator transcription factor [Gammaproteobacteria bacterium]
MRALVIEDENELRSQIVGRLREEGFAIDEAADGQEGLYLATEMPLDIAIIDLGLPGMDGAEIIKQTRARDKHYPILILTARDTWQDKVEGLESGADDYLAKPFHMEELLARIRALLRRSGGWSDSVLHFGELQVDTRSQQVSVKDKVVELTAYEYKVMEYLAIHAGQVISKNVLLDHLYDEDTDRDPNILEVFVKRLRSKLDPEKTLNPIETLRGRGYRLALKRGNTQGDQDTDKPGG